LATVAANAEVLRLRYKFSLHSVLIWGTHAPMPRRGPCAKVGRV